MPMFSFWSLMFNFFKNRDSAFIVYQMGKVGSSTLQKSLERVYGKRNVLHTHDHAKAREYIEKWSRIFDAVIVITGFREPLSRCISAYFQTFTDENHIWFVGKKDEVMKKSIDWLIDDFNEKVIPHIHKVVGPWLNNYERVTGCRITDFNRTKGCLKASAGNVHYYIYKLETLTDFQNEMASDRYLKKIRFVNVGLSQDKWYDKMYRDFKRNYKINIDMYNKLYGDIDFVRNLYSDQEIINFTNGFVLQPNS